ncbi:helix-turn-helix domain-containing protein [Kallotenue papyrolyticum]|uniref:helix-turn-helix domain-containing protein n=1 Tax=Kallotenue papyrolyticum TaxID=1325125 RepID=UPI0004786250|nr:helix-turn-helix transcriptional regulator [Kallotenue papyrolyticum]
MLAMAEPKVASLGDAVLFYRQRAGLTQEQLAERLGVSREAVRKIETGRTKRPSNKTLRRLEDTIGLSYRRALELMGEVEPDPDQDERLGVLLIQIAALPDREERRRAWQNLPDPVRAAILRLAQDVLQDTLQQLQAGYPESSPGQEQQVT